MSLSILKVIRKIKFSKKKLKTIVVILLIIMVVLFIFASLINPIIMDTVELKSKSLASRAINASIADVIINSIIYDDLVNIITDEFGMVSMIQANSLEINNLSKDVAQTTEYKIEEYGKKGVTIPMGTFTGIPLLVGRGPSLKVKMIPIGAVTCTFISNFETAGINQTMHKIYLKVMANIGVVMPFSSKKFIAEQQVLICESIIVGSVPEVFLHSDTLDTLLNFVPY